MSVTQERENVSGSRANAYSRIVRLHGEGILTTFGHFVDPMKAGLQSSACVTLKVKAAFVAGAKGTATATGHTQGAPLPMVHHYPRCTISRWWAAALTSC